MGHSWAGYCIVIKRVVEFKGSLGGGGVFVKAGASSLAHVAWPGNGGFNPRFAQKSNKLIHY